eukprot:tig00020944_g16359.t1
MWEFDTWVPGAERERDRCKPLQAGASLRREMPLQAAAAGIGTLMAPLLAPLLAPLHAAVARANPHYRSPGRPPHRPVQHSEFVKQEHSRKRYWARSYAAFDAFFNFEPNVGHRAIAEYERTGRLLHVVTQNVDQLHQRAGTSPRLLTELHGNLRSAACLSCGSSEDRRSIQERLRHLNPLWPPQNLRSHSSSQSSRLRPDGDTELVDHPDVYAKFHVPHCLSCSGILKPSVVFFGGSVDKAVAEEAARKASEADAVLVVGSSLATYSAYRLVQERLGRLLPAVLAPGEVVELEGAGA